MKPTPGHDSLHDTSNEKPYSEERQRSSISFTNEAGLAVNAAQRVAIRSRLIRMREITTAYMH